MSEPKVYDISLTIQPGMQLFPGNPPFSIDTVKSIPQGSSSNVSLLRIGTHSATHVDAPSHFIPGASGVDRIGPEVLLGQARLFQLPDAHHIDREVLKGLDLKDVKRLLISTRDSALLKRRRLDLDTHSSQRMPPATS